MAAALERAEARVAQLAAHLSNGGRKEEEEEAGQLVALTCSAQRAFPAALSAFLRRT